MNEKPLEYPDMVFEEARSQFESLQEFLSITRMYLAQEHAQYIKSHNQHQKMHPYLLMDDEIGGGYLDEFLGGLGEHAHTFPSLLYHAYLILACSLFEGAMLRICQAMNQLGLTDMQWDKPRGRVLQKTRRLLREAGLKMEPAEKRTIFSKLENYFLARNCVVHNRGQLKKDGQLLKHATASGVVSDGYDETFLEPTEEYCREVGETMLSFFFALQRSYWKTEKSRK